MPLAQAPTHVVHPLEPIYSKDSRVLVLGTMPSPRSRQERFYYAHPQNRFWRVLAALFDEPVPLNNDERRTLVLSHGIALWDVLQSCDIAGASDASIKNARPNDLSRVLKAANIQHVFTTGATAARYYRKFDQPLYPHVAFTALPSTSAANARMSLEDLIDAYQPLKDCCIKPKHALY